MIETLNADFKTGHCQLCINDNATSQNTCSSFQLLFGALVLAQLTGAKRYLMVFIAHRQMRSTLIGNGFTSNHFVAPIVVADADEVKGTI